MIDMQLLISDRLNRFIENHFTYEDIGDAENGPELDYWYNGPDWAIDLLDRTIDAPLHRAEVNNLYF